VKKNKKYQNPPIKIIIGIIFIVLIIYVFIGFKSKKDQLDNVPWYPIDSNVVTTEKQTVVPKKVPKDSPKIDISEISKYSDYGYGKWEFGEGDKRVQRFDLMRAGYKPSTVDKKLLNFFAITDIHITDKESPAQAIYLRNQGGSYSAYSGVMLYTTQVLDATLQTINVLHKENPFSFGISLGDSVNSSQRNELSWYIDVLEGGVIKPYSGVKSESMPDYQTTYKAVGLNASIPWYQTLGNHDHFWMGFLPPDDHIRKTLNGKEILSLGNPFIDQNAINSRQYYMGSIDGKTTYGSIIGEGSTDVPTPTIASADVNRKINSTPEWMNKFYNSWSKPKGHGFDNKKYINEGFANYTFEPKSTFPIKIIVLNDTQRDDDPNDPVALGFGKDSYGYGHGELDDARYKWLVNELKTGQAQGKLMIIAAHVPIAVEKNPSMMAWNEDFEKKLITELHNYPNLIMWISGHRHKDTITAIKSPDPARPELGFWEVETHSLRDFPQQFRTFQIVMNTDKTVSIFVTNVDPAVKEGSLAAISRSYAIAASQILPAKPTPIPDGSYSGNAELIKQLDPKMINKIQTD